MNSNLKTASQIALAFAAVVGVGVGLPYLAIGRKGGPFTHEEHTDWGTVIALENCETGKYSLNCTLTTDKVQFARIDVTDFSPNHNKPLVIGDRIGMTFKGNDVRQETFYTRNGVESRQGTCMDWMPCFKPKP